MPGRIERPPELACYRASEHEIRAMSAEARVAHTCTGCGAVYRFSEFVRECAGHHRKLCPRGEKPA